MHPVAFPLQLFVAGLEGFFHADADAYDRRARLMAEIAMIVHMMNARQLPDTQQYILPRPDLS